MFTSPSRRRCALLAAHLRPRRCFRSFSGGITLSTTASTSTASSSSSPPRLLQRVLIANRGEIAIRVARAAQEVGIATVAVYTEEDADALHTRIADEAVAVNSYLDGSQLLELARSTHSDCIHPGYGFLSEHAPFAELCEASGVTFVGPPAACIALFGDKTRARSLAESCGVPVLAGSRDAFTDHASLNAYVSSLDVSAAYPLLLKAANGGGGRGMRLVERPGDLDDAFTRCLSEARGAFGDSGGGGSGGGGGGGGAGVFVEQYLPSARHIEVQIMADGTGKVR